VAKYGLDEVGVVGDIFAGIGTDRELVAGYVGHDPHDVAVFDFLPLQAAGKGGAIDERFEGFGGADCWYVRIGLAGGCAGGSRLRAAEGRVSKQWILAIGFREHQDEPSFRTTKGNVDEAAGFGALKEIAGAVNGIKNDGSPFATLSFVDGAYAYLFGDLAEDGAEQSALGTKRG
jgi:hypothetical protein